MMKREREAPLGATDAQPRAHRLAPVTIAAASLVTILPIVVRVPLLPPFGLMMLLAWRVRRPDVIRSWVPLPLGLFDDLVSGQPLGSAMLLWTACVLTIDMIDTRLVWREFWEDWLIATAAIGAALIGGRLVATPIGAQVDNALLLQILASAALFPAAAGLCAWLDPRLSRE